MGVGPGRARYDRRAGVAGGRVSIRVKFVPRDLWVGLYVGPAEYGIGPRGQFRSRSVYLCILPMLPVVITRTVYR